MDVPKPVIPSDPPDASGDSARQQLVSRFRACELLRPMRRSCHDPGDRLEYSITGVSPAHTARMVAQVERAVGGGFAGQVYRVRLLDLQADDGSVSGLTIGQSYALKILTPPSAFSRVFRNTLYFMAYQGAFSAQVNPASVRVGVLWQKLIRRAAQLRFGRDDAVCDTYATFYDADLHSFGEINEWIDGRIWKFEVDDALFSRWDFRGPPPPDHNSPEYVHKKLFMGELVALLHEMGAPELARQYEWWSLKSQPNVLKRLSAGDQPEAGLTAVDFRAGLALLPFLPMSPVDVPLIIKGLFRGRVVQFDRSDPARRRKFLQAHAEQLEDLQPAVAELEEQEEKHRASLPDVTHHHVRLLTSGKLRQSVREGAVQAWSSLGWLDEEHAARLRNSRVLFPLLFPLVFMLAAVPWLGRRLVKLWGHAQARQHVWQCLTRAGYLGRSIRASAAETLIDWHRQERMSEQRVLALADRPLSVLWRRLLLGWLPATWYRLVTDWGYAWQRVRAAIAFTGQFLRTPAFREAWLLEQVRLGRDEGMLSEAEADKVTEQIKDPYIQKYLRCLAVHLCTVPVTQVVMVLVGGGVAFYCYAYKGLSWGESAAAGSAAGALIQLLPISPGSIARGVFVLYLMVKERDIRNYYVAAPISFIHVIGYLAFPLQMVKQNPGLARFMAGRWARNLTRVVPVFGEGGALLEHFVFDLFFNLPLSARRSAKRRPLAWAAGGLLATAAVVLAAFLGYARVWEWRQPKIELQGVTVRSVAPYYQSGGELHWSLDGTRVFFEPGPDVPTDVVDYPATHWDPAVGAASVVDAVVRKSFFGDEYDGLAIRRHSPGPTTRVTEAPAAPRPRRAPATPD